MSFRPLAQKEKKNRLMVWFNKDKKKQVGGGGECKLGRREIEWERERGAKVDDWLYIVFEEIFFCFSKEEELHRPFTTPDPSSVFLF